MVLVSDHRMSGQMIKETLELTKSIVHRIVT